jgi:hypothetical protein
MREAARGSGCALMLALALVLVLIPLMRASGMSRGQTADTIDSMFPGALDISGVSTAHGGSFVEPAPAFKLPEPVAQAPQPLPTQAAPQPTQTSGGGGGSTGGGGAPPPAGCTPSAPNQITGPGTISGSPNGNGGSWQVSNINSSSPTYTDSGMKSCGLHHTMRVMGHWSAPDMYTGTVNSCNLSTGSSVSVTLSTTHPGATFNTATVNVTYDNGC